MTRRVAFVADASDDGKRLDVALSAHTTHSRSHCAQIVRSGLVTVDGRRAKAAHVIAAGERIEADIPAPVKPSARPESIPIDIIYDDADLCVVDKPAGMSTHPAPGSASGTLVNALLAALGPLPAINGVLRPGIVHRLDKGTSGLLVVAKSERAMRALSSMMAARDIKRSYDAVVWGRPASARGTIDAPIARDPAVRTRFAVAEKDGGKRAVTRYAVTERFHLRGTAPARAPSDLALLSLDLETGRTHQIRVHCAAVGLPIVGDPTYGGGMPRLGARRPMLHAARLRFAHPVSGEPLAFNAPWPEDFAALVARLRDGRAE